MTNITNNQGTTLIEVLISLILIAITTLGGIALYFNATELQAIVLHKKMVIEEANNQMERCRRASCAEGTTDINIGGLTVQNGMTIQDVSSPWAGYEQKVVSITWNEPGSTTRDFNVQFSTLVPQ